MRQHLDFWFEFASNYSYLSVMRIEALARQADISINWRPFLLGPIFKELGWNTSPFVLQKEKGAYVWRDMQRRCAKYGLPFKRPSQFPRSGLLPARVGVLGMNEPWIGEFSRRIMLQNWAHDREINEVDVVQQGLQGLVADPELTIESAQSESAKKFLRQQTATARELGLFGAPTFFVNGEMFWGDDRLEDAIAACSTEDEK